MRTSPTRINRGLSPCGCGCKGRDHWHRASFLRILRDVKPPVSQGVWAALGGGKWEPAEVTAEALVSLPWGQTRVFQAGGVWWIERESALDAQNREGKS